MLRLWGVVVRVGVVLALSQLASRAFAFTETWSNSGDLEGWYSYYGDLVLSHNDSLGTLDWSVVDASEDYINADVGSSGGAFVGDLRPYEGDMFALDFYVSPGSSVSKVALDLFYSDTGDEWESVLPITQEGVWLHFDVPLLESSFSQIGGLQNWDYLLANVDETSIHVWWSDASDGRLDNFQLGASAIPEPGTLGLMGLGLAARVFRRRKRS